MNVGMTRGTPCIIFMMMVYIDDDHDCTDHDGEIMVMIMMKITRMMIVPRECRNDAGHSVHNLHHDDYIDDDHDCTGDVDDNGDNHDEDYTDDDDLTT